MRRLAIQIQRIDFETEMLKIGHGRESTAKDVDIAMSKAKQENALPDLQPILDCELDRLPALAK
jgi:hypothetical protein